MHAAPFARVPSYSRDGRQGLSLARLHFGDASARQRESPTQLNIKHVLAKKARRGRCCNGHERQQIASFQSYRAQPRITQAAISSSQGVDPENSGTVTSRRRENRIQKSAHGALLLLSFDLLTNLVSRGRWTLKEGRPKSGDWQGKVIFTEDRARRVSSRWGSGWAGFGNLAHGFGRSIQADDDAGSAGCNPDRWRGEVRRSNQQSCDQPK